MGIHKSCLQILFVLQDLKFNYSTVDEFNHNCSSVASNIELSIFHLNIRSLNKNSEELYNFFAADQS